MLNHPGQSVRNLRLHFRPTDSSQADIHTPQKILRFDIREVGGCCCGGLAV